MTKGEFLEGAEIAQSIIDLAAQTRKVNPTTHARAMYMLAYAQLRAVLKSFKSSGRMHNALAASSTNLPNSLGERVTPFPFLTTCLVWERHSMVYIGIRIEFTI